MSALETTFQILGPAGIYVKAGVDFKPDATLKAKGNYEWDATKNEYKVGGSIVTQWISAVMVVAAVAVGYVMMLAYQSATPEQYFLPFMALFMILTVGAVAYVAIPKEANPEVPLPLVYVSTGLEGISPADAERLLIEPMETEFAAITGLE